MLANEYLSNFLKIDQPMEKQPIRYSSVALLLRGARKLSGRNIENGSYEMNELNEQNFIEQTFFSFQFAGLINYLIFLEQIGSIFKPINQEAPTGKGRGNGIYRTLSYYTNLNDKKKKSVVALRNSLTHKFGLATESKPNSGFPARFSLSISRNDEIIEIPKEGSCWKGDFSNKSDDCLTIVYIIDLLDQIENIYQNIYDNLNDDNIEMLIELDELKARYTIIA